MDKIRTEDIRGTEDATICRFVDEARVVPLGHLAVPRRTRRYSEDTVGGWNWPPGRLWKELREDLWME